MIRTNLFSWVIGWLSLISGSSLNNHLLSYGVDGFPKQQDRSTTCHFWEECQLFHSQWSPLHSHLLYYGEFIAITVLPGLARTCLCVHLLTRWNLLLFWNPLQNCIQLNLNACCHVVVSFLSVVIVAMIVLAHRIVVFWLKCRIWNVLLTPEAGFLQGISLILSVLQVVRLPNIKVGLSISYSPSLVILFCNNMWWIC